MAGRHILSVLGRRFKCSKRLLRLAWLISFVAFSLGGRAGIDAMASIEIVPSARDDRANNQHTNQQENHPPSFRHFMTF